MVPEAGRAVDWSRVIVVGANGAGKTQAALLLARRLEVEVVHKDRVALTQAWRQRAVAEVLADLQAAVAGERWVLEGGPSVLAAPLLARATVVVWLDVPAYRRGWRVFWRSVRYFGRVRPEHPAGNRDWPGMRQGRFLWRVFSGGQAATLQIENRLRDASVPVLRLPDVKDFLAASLKY